MSEIGSVTIGLREIYDKVLEVGQSVDRLLERVERLEEDAQSAEDLKDMTKTALQTASAALELAKEVKSNQRWLWRTVVGTVVIAATGIIFAHFG